MATRGTTMRPWYLSRGLVVFVLALFQRATIAPPTGRGPQVEIIEWCTTSS